MVDETVRSVVVWGMDEIGLDLLFIQDPSERGSSFTVWRTSNGVMSMSLNADGGRRWAVALRE